MNGKSMPPSCAPPLQFEPLAGLVAPCHGQRALPLAAGIQPGQGTPETTTLLDTLEMSDVSWLVLVISTELA